MKPQYPSDQNQFRNQEQNQNTSRDLNQGGDFISGMSSQKQDAGSLYNADRGVTTDRNLGINRDDSMNSGIGTRDGGAHFSGTQNQDTGGGLTGQRDLTGGFTSQQRTAEEIRRDGQSSGPVPARDFSQGDAAGFDREADRIAQTDLGAAGGAGSRWSPEQDVTTVRNDADTANFNQDRAGLVNDDLEDRHDANRDPITGAPGSHPVGTGIGAASAGAVGAAIGIAGGPVGMALGAAVGAIVGGLAGKATAEAVNPTDYDENHWRENYTSEPHHDSSYGFEDYDPAYRYGTASAETYRGRRFEDAESELSQGWENVKGKSRLNWEKAKGAVRSAWHKTERAMPGDFDRDGR